MQQHNMQTLHQCQQWTFALAWCLSHLGEDRPDRWRQKSAAALLRQVFDCWEFAAQRSDLLWCELCRQQRRALAAGHVRVMICEEHVVRRLVHDIHIQSALGDGRSRSRGMQLPAC